MLDKHTLALINLIGNSLDVLGALYLAYDLLGGEHGPLRTLTRGVTYGALYAAGFGAFFGPIFGLSTGVTFGATLAWEFSRAARNRPKPGLWYDAAMSTIRGCGFAVGTGFLYGVRFGLLFGALSAVGQVIAYRLGIRPTLDFVAGTGPRITWRQFLAAVNRTFGYAGAGYFSALIAHRHIQAWHVGLLAGTAIGAITAVASACSPFVEWHAEHLPQKRMGTVGVGLILIGFGLQSVQYWMALLAG